MTCFFARTLDTRSKFRVFNLKGQKVNFFYWLIRSILYSYHHHHHYLKFPFSSGAKTYLSQSKDGDEIVKIG